MSKTVSIKEGQTAKTFSDVAKLKTNLVGGGTALWVPEDETQLVEKTITQNGEYLPSSDNAYGFGKVTVDIDLPTKSITANGTYNASSDNKEGWSKVTVNVPTEGASGTDTSGDPYSITDDDFGLPTFTDSNGNEYDMEVSTDPETGEPVVTLSKLPKSIVITAGSPTYNDGDAFDKSRYTVKANWDTAGGTQSDVTASCTFVPADGTILHYGTDYTMTVEWTYKGRTYRTAETLVVEATPSYSGYAYAKVSQSTVSEWDSGDASAQYYNVTQEGSAYIVRLVTIVAFETDRQYKYTHDGSITQKNPEYSYTKNGKQVFYTWESVTSSMVDTSEVIHIADVELSQPPIGNYDTIAWDLIYG